MTLGRDFKAWTRAWELVDYFGPGKTWVNINWKKSHWNWIGKWAAVNQAQGIWWVVQRASIAA